MISPQQEQAMIAARAAKRQDKKHPYCINTQDGRLLPNVPKIREHKNYRVYDGPTDGTRQERLAWISKAISRKPIIVDSSENEPEPFDAGKATAEDLCVFAMDQWGAALDPSKSVGVLRKEVMKLAKAAEAADANKPDNTDLG
jgi:hypothetical protein